MVIRMKKVTIGIFAHANAGKTTITEQLLYRTKVTSSVGRVDSGTTVTDSMSIEKERGITIQSSVVSFNIGDIKFQLIDTPGHIDFYAEVERAINALDGAVLVISGVEGVEAQTFSIWKQLQEKNVPTIIYINKMDRMGADYSRVLIELQSKLHANVIPINWINKQGDDYSNDTLPKEEMLNYLFDTDPEFAYSALENIKNIELDNLNEHIYELSRNNRLSVVIGGSALKGVGITELVECVHHCFPGYSENNGEFFGYVFAVRVREGKKRVFIKVLRGKLALKDLLRIDEGNEIKVSSLYLSEGIIFRPVDELKCGDVGIIDNLPVSSGQYIGVCDGSERKSNYMYPILDMQVEFSDKYDVYEIINALNILNEEDPCINVRYSTETKKIIISLMGEVQGQVIVQMMKERFELDIKLCNPVIVHKETPSQIGKGSCYYTRVSGVELEVLPLEPGSGLKYKSKLSTDFLHKKYQRQTERLVMKYIKQGVMGWEVTDAEVHLINGKFDSLGSDPLHFNIAVPLALMRALRQCHEKILEPISQFVVVSPESSFNVVLQYLNGKGATFEISYESNNIVKINGEINTKLIFDAPLDIIKLTSGLGFFYSRIAKYSLSAEQNIENEFVGADPRNEVQFVISDMKAGLDSLDPIMSKKKKESKSKYKRVQKEREIKELKKKGLL